MKIEWKKLSKSKGYKSLKAAYIHDVQESAKERYPMRNKDKFLKHFNWVINRAKHYSNQTGKTVEEILNEWEEERSYWWLSYYQDGNQPKLHSNSLEPLGVNGHRKYFLKNQWNHNKSDIKKEVMKFIQREQKRFSNKKKTRWTMDRKKRGY